MNKLSSRELITGTDDYIVTIAIGDQYYSDWEKFSSSFWLDYCKKFNLGLLIIHADIIDQSNTHWKKATWQKFLLGEYMQLYFPNIKRICYLDTDILISPLAPNIFDFHQDGCMSLVSLFNGLPYDRFETIEKLTWLRNQSSEGKYPLDSAIYMSIADLYDYHNLPAQNDYACAGMFIMEVAIHSKVMNQFFFEIDKNISTITNGGDQTHFNFMAQNNFTINWLPYKFQSIWSYEAANYYPSVFFDQYSDISYLSIQNSLVNKYFLHFAGGWNECQQWKDHRIAQEAILLGNISSLIAYQNYGTKSGRPVGHVKFQIDLGKN